MMTTDSDTSPAGLVDALHGTFGRHAGMRASHAKGVCARGEFFPADGVDDFVRSIMFGEKRLAATVRFSVGGGNPLVSDKSRSVRGMSLRLRGAGQEYDLLMVSEPVFFAATPASFVSFLQARVADPATGKPDPARIATHNATHPEGARQPALLAAHAAPASYATTPYFSNHAFLFENRLMQRQAARLFADPLAGTHYLGAGEEASFPDTFLQGELARRLAAGPVEFILKAQLPADGDSLRDPSTMWRGAGHVALGRLSVTGLEAEAQCDARAFLPLTLPEGIHATDDPLLRARAGAYAVSLARRNARQAP